MNYYQQYIEDCLRTESPYTFTITNPLVSPRLLHGVIGLVTESGELLDTIKKSLFYGKPLDKTNLIEELGDLLWYISLIIKDCDITYNNVMKVKYSTRRNEMVNHNIDYYLTRIIKLDLTVKDLLDLITPESYYFGNKDELVSDIEIELQYILSAIYNLAIDLDTTIEQVMTININKLKLRYPDKFNSDQAINRDVDSERELLEQQVTGNEIGDIYQLLI